MATLAQQQAYISEMEPYADQLYGNSQTESPQEALAQWALETGWGTETGTASNPIVNNPGNIMGANGQIASYSTLGDGVGAYAQTEANYATSTMGALNPQIWAQEQAEYDPGNPNYSQALQSTLQTVQRLDGTTSQPDYTLSNGQVIASSPDGSTLVPQDSQIPTSQKMGCQQPSINPGTWIPWAECEAFNLLFVFLGVVILVAVIFSQINGSDSVTSALALAGVAG